MPMPVRNLMRAINCAKILETIRTAGMISRIEIARITALSQASVTGLTADLIRDGLIQEKQAGNYAGGRPPMLLALNPGGAFVIGVNLSIHRISVVILDLEATVIASHAQPLKPVFHSVDQIAELIVTAVQGCIWEANFTKEQISGVGIGIPGLVDADTGVIRFLPNYDWQHADLKQRVQSRLQCPCYIDNSSNTLALAENWFGEGKGLDNFLVVSIENGVGLGVFIDGRLYRGHSGIAGEFGHLSIDPEGALCRCGQRGCIESYLGIAYLLNAVDAAIRKGEWEGEEPSDLSLDWLFETTRAGHPTLAKIFGCAGRALGQGIAYLNALFNPAKIVITGRGVQAGEVLFDAMYQSLASNRSLKSSLELPEILIQNWSDLDWARGAGALVLQELFKSPLGQVATDR
jgi:predicted NBD/HSP70 family sugar kinase